MDADAGPRGKRQRAVGMTAVVMGYILLAIG